MILTPEEATKKLTDITSSYENELRSHLNNVRKSIKGLNETAINIEIRLSSLAKQEERGGARRLRFPPEVYKERNESIRRMYIEEKKPSRDIAIEMNISRTSLANVIKKIRADHNLTTQIEKKKFLSSDTPVKDIFLEKDVASSDIAENLKTQ